MNTSAQTGNQLDGIIIKDTYTAGELLTISRQLGIPVNDTVRLIQSQLTANR